MPEKVLLATDGSKDAALAARAAVDVCQRTGAELHVVHAWHSVPTARFRPFMRAELKKLGNELLEEGVKRVKCAGFDGRQQEHRASVFFSHGGMVELAGTDADRVLNAMEDFAGYHRS